MNNIYVEKLVNDNIGLIYWGFNMFSEKYPEKYHDDIYSLANYSLYWAAVNYNPDKKVKFSTFYSKILHNEIAKFIRENNTKSRKCEYGDDISLYTPVNDTNNLDIESLLSSKNNDLDDNITVRDILNELYSRLDDVCKKIVRLRIENPSISQYELSEVVGISQPHVCRKLKEIRKEFNGIVKI